MKLKSGLYDQLITRELDALLQETTWFTESEALHPDSAEDQLSRHIHQATMRALKAIKGENKLERQVALANRVIQTLVDSSTTAENTDTVLPSVLLSALPQRQKALGTGRIERPGLSLRHSALIVNGPNDRRVGREIALELPSADRVDLLMSFVMWEGFVELREPLTQFLSLGKPLRLLTTTYMHHTKVEALEALKELGAQIRVSYDPRRTRLHAKAWLFHRNTGFSTGIIGSSNLSQAALRDGCEWNVRLSNADNRSILQKFQATFNQYWDDENTYKPYDADRFRAATAIRHDVSRDALAHVVQLRPYPHQAAVLDALKTEREDSIVV